MNETNCFWNYAAKDADEYELRKHHSFHWMLASFKFSTINS